MSNYNEIKTLFTNEIMNSPQYQIALKIKNLLIEEINAPNIDFSFCYNFQDSDYIDINNKEYEENIIYLGLKIILGVEVELFNNGMNRGVIIVMKHFL
jgi:hypothetical protein